MAADRAEAATAVIMRGGLVGNRLFETMVNNVMQQRRLRQHEQQHEAERAPCFRQSGVSCAGRRLDKNQIHCSGEIGRQDKISSSGFNVLFSFPPHLVSLSGGGSEG